MKNKINEIKHKTHSIWSQTASKGGNTFIADHLIDAMDSISVVYLVLNRFRRVGDHSVTTKAVYQLKNA